MFAAPAGCCVPGFMPGGRKREETGCHDAGGRRKRRRSCRGEIVFREKKAGKKKAPQEQGEEGAWVVVESSAPVQCVLRLRAELSGGRRSRSPAA